MEQKLSEVNTKTLSRGQNKLIELKIAEGDYEVHVNYNRN